MAFGALYEYVREETCEGVSPEHILVFAFRAAKKLKWSIKRISEDGFIAYNNRSMGSWGEDIRFEITGESFSITSEYSRRQLMARRRNRRNAEEFIYMFKYMKNNMSAAEAERQYAKLKPRFVLKKEMSVSRPESERGYKLPPFFAFFKPVPKYTITPLLIDLNVGVFIAMVLSGAGIFLPDVETLIAWGANFSPQTLGGEWWRLLSNCFVHIGILHLLMNMYALFYVGTLLEPYLGKARFLSAYLLSGFFASVVSSWWNEMTVSAGASGAIFGMYGVFLSMLTVKVIYKAKRKALLTSVVVFVTYNLLAGMKGGIDNAAHIGGLVSGIICGYIYCPGFIHIRNKKIKYGTLAVATALIVVVGTGICMNVEPYEIKEYDRKMETFGEWEKKALAVYDIFEDASRETVLHEIETKMVFYWRKNRQLLEEVGNLKLPPQLYELVRKLKEYCEVRIRVSEIMYKSVFEDTDVYEHQIDSLNFRIDEILSELENE